MSKYATAALAVLAFSSLCSAQSANLKADMHATYDRVAEIYNDRNLADIMAMLSPDYKWTLCDGYVLKREAVQSSILDQFTQEGHWHIDILNVLGAGPVATAIVKFQFAGTVLDPAQKAYKIEFTSTERQTWIKTAHGWQQQSDEMLGQESTIDGKKARPNMSSTSKPSTVPHQAYPSGAGL